MGRLIKNHLARLVVMSAGVYQIVAAISGLFWPKIFFDFFSRSLDPLVKPLPILQILNLLIGFTMLAWEWPLGMIAGSALHRSIVARMVFLPVAVLASVLLYQATNSAIYYMVGLIFYAWAHNEGEVVADEAWSLPSRPKTGNV
ncbi:unnamed protein product [Blumeria hordei]|uniref:DUF7727 domain-containing protein n=2 Tax=Blumeria hordei TaxID=2867405 RepID=A0A383UTA4_BLUHO|nr:hypothetical protein BGHDH14_bgh00803 [Blumeria hordei DH14]SZF03117.1 unnamed protein product [Blumeria hordei]